jgi:hypothetical protein
MGFIEAIETSGIATWVRESPSIFAYTGVLSAHAIGLAIAVGVNVLIALRLLGFASDFPATALRRLFPLFYAGFTINLISGSMLLAASFSTLLGRWMFLSKLAFIVLAMINFEVMRAKVFGPVTAAAGGTAAFDDQAARKYAWIALILWGLAVISGRLTSYPTFVEAVFGF